MRSRIAWWAAAGFLVAGCWALFAIATFPHTNERMRDLWVLIGVTCPVAFIGRHFQLSLNWVLAANGATYALVGLIGEALRRQFSHSR